LITEELRKAGFIN